MVSCNMMRVITFLVVLIGSLTLSSCGVIFGGSQYSAAVIARNQSDAQISVNGLVRGKGNVMGVYMRKDPLVIEIRQADCDPQVWYFNPKIRTGNLILSGISFGLTGILVDLLTGACYQPNFKGDPSIERISRKEFLFSLDYRGCQ